MGLNSHAVIKSMWVCGVATADQMFACLLLDFDVIVLQMLKLI